MRVSPHLAGLLLRSWLLLVLAGLGVTAAMATGAAWRAMTEHAPAPTATPAGYEAQEHFPGAALLYLEEAPALPQPTGATGSVELPPVPVPAADEVLIEVRSVGVCGSDTHYYDHGRIGDHVVTGPLVLGHESAGVIVAVGADVDPARVGERVAIEPGVPCRQCTQCLSGRYNLCPDMVFHATPPVDGTLAEYVTHLASFAFALPDAVSLAHSPS